MDDRDSQKRMLDYDFKARDGTLIPGPSHFRRFSMSLISFSRGGHRKAERNFLYRMVANIWRSWLKFLHIIFELFVSTCRST